MKPAYSIIISVVLSAILTLGAAFYVMHSKDGEPVIPTHDAAFERVKATNTIRCGYSVRTPGMMKDPQTGQLGGIFYDFLEAIGQHTGMKIEWTEEVGLSDFPAALASGRIDAMCSGVWPKATDAKNVLYTKPVYYLPVWAYTRANDTRFDNALDIINNPAVKISTMDSDLSSEIAHNRFPQAQIVPAPLSNDTNVLLLNVGTGKADVTFIDAWTAAAFMEKNPNVLKITNPDHPLRMFGHTIAIAQGDQSLENLLNTATDEILSSGEMDGIVNKYAKIPGVLLMKKDTYQ